MNKTTTFEKITIIAAFTLIFFDWGYLGLTLLISFISFGQGKAKDYRLAIKQLMNTKALWSLRPWKITFTVGIMSVCLAAGAGMLSLTSFSFIAPNLTSSFLFEINNRILDFGFIFWGIVFAPFVEEVFFRGLFLGSLTNKYGFAKATLISSLVFGVLHANPLGATFFGIAMCFIFLHTKSLVFPIILHSLNNLIALSYAIYTYDGKTFSKDDILSDLQSSETITTATLFLIAGIPAFIWLLKNRLTHEKIQFPFTEKDCFEKRV